jgi:hypothetical protein
MQGLPNFPIKAWYHLFIALGILGIGASATVDLKGIQNAHALLVSLGVLLIGIGEWINHPLQTAILPANYLYGGGKITGYPRNNSFLGVAFDVAGVALFAVGVWKIITAP